MIRLEEEYIFVGQNFRLSYYGNTFPYFQPALYEDCMDFCSEHKIVPRLKLVTADQLPEVYANLAQKNDQEWK